jgi:hypothetical protein
MLMADNIKIIIGVILVLLLIVAFVFLTKPSSVVSGKPINELEKNDVLVFENKEYALMNKTQNKNDDSFVDLGMLDSEDKPVSVTLDDTAIVPVKIEIAWYDFTPIPSVPPTPNLPSPTPVTVPIPTPPAAPNVTPPTPPNVSVPTPPNVTTPPQPTPPNATPPTPPMPIPPNATTPPPPPPVPIVITPPTPLPAHCSDSTWNGDESDLDCGGSCPGCLSSGMYNYCWDNSDCQSGNCDISIAQRPLPPGQTIATLRALAGQTWIIPYQGQCR